MVGSLRTLLRVMRDYSAKIWLICYLTDSKYEDYLSKGYIKGRLLDIGCGAKPYTELFAAHVTEHVGFDHQQTPYYHRPIDVFATAYNIPFKDESFDSGICNAVLEHLEEPLAALTECYRVLKPGGMVVFSVPFIWHLHEEPRDFFRFSKHGLRYLLEKTGFEIVELKALSGFWITSGQMFVYYLYRFRRGPLRWLRIIDILGIIIQVFVYFLERIDRAEEWTWMYIVLVRKST